MALDSWTPLPAATVDASVADTAALSPGETPTVKPRLRFNLLPRSMQARPYLYCNVMTEFTKEGRKRAPKDRSQPQYYVFQEGGYVQKGDGAPAREVPPAPERLTGALARALAESNFLESKSKDQRPSLVVIYNYGSHTMPQITLDEVAAESNAWRDYENRAIRATAEEDVAAPATGLGLVKGANEWLDLVLGDVALRRQVIERATLVGGTKFAEELADVMNEEAHDRQTKLATSRFMARPGTTLDFPVSMPEADMTSPFQQFRRRNAQRMHLVETSFASCYFIVASAYDYRDLAKGRKVLLWRTRMSVDSDGIALVEAASAMIATAGPFFGREMKEAASVERRVSRGSRVEVGDAVVVGEEALPEPAKPVAAPPQGEPVGR